MNLSKIELNIRLKIHFNFMVVSYSHIHKKMWKSISFSSKVLRFCNKILHFAWFLSRTKMQRIHYYTYNTSFSALMFLTKNSLKLLYNYSNPCLDLTIAWIVNHINSCEGGKKKYNLQFFHLNYLVLLLAPISTTLQLHFITKQTISFRPHKTDYARVFPTG